MPPDTPASGGTLRRTLLLTPFILIALGAYGCAELGLFLAKEDTLQKADAILVLSGTSMRRPLEAADLYLEGYGSRIVLTRQTLDDGERALVGRGIPFVEDVARVRDAFVQLGIPEEAILVPERIHDSTAAEAITLRELTNRRGWRRVIVVSSKYHLRRAGFAFRRELRETGVQIMMRGTRYDGLEPNGWWRRRQDIREIIQEVPKFVAYLLGLGA